MLETTNIWSVNLIKNGLLKIQYICAVSGSALELWAWKIREILVRTRKNKPIEARTATTIVMGVIRLPGTAFISCKLCGQGEYFVFGWRVLPARNAMCYLKITLIVMPQKASCIHPLSTLRRGQNPWFLMVKFYVFGVTVTTVSALFYLT